METNNGKDTTMKAQSIAQFLATPHNPNTKKMIADRDWDGIQFSWSSTYDDAHGIPHPTIPFVVRAALREEAAKAGIDLPRVFPAE